MTKTFTLIFSLCVALVSCYYDIESELYPSPCDLPETVSYSTDIKPITDARCATSGCHDSGSENGDFTSIDDFQVYAENGSLINAISISQTMPPLGPIPPCEQELIKKWVDQGSLNN